LAAAAALGCSGGAGRPPEPLRLLETLVPVRPPAAGAPLLLVGRWEVCRRDLDPSSPDEVSDLPATGLDRGEAAAWAAARGFRLPTLAEWRHLAGDGPVSGSRLPSLAANTLDLGLGQPLPVGVFELGRTADGLYDLDGNVWEWVADEAPAPFGLPPRALACGGSFASLARIGHAGRGAVRLLEPGERADDLGFRLVTEAASWLRDWIEPLWSSARWRNRIAAAFAGWPAELRERLAAELARVGASESFRAAVAGGGPTGR
ncbi:MAG: hypothetical protein D6702_01230, partial [Planctomycetota bacterium]